MEGMQEGTLFNREVVEAEDAASRATSTAGSEDGGDAADTARDCATAARNASRKLQSLPTEVHAPADTPWPCVCQIECDTGGPCTLGFEP